MTKDKLTPTEASPERVYSHTEAPKQAEPALLTETNALMGLIISAAAILTIFYKLFGFGRDVQDLKAREAQLAERKELNAALVQVSNNSSRIDALERQDNTREIRVVRLEQDMHYIKESQARLESKLDRYFEQLTTAIGEVRKAIL